MMPLVRFSQLYGYLYGSVCLCVLLQGCALLPDSTRERLTYDSRREWQRLTGSDWQAVRTRSGLAKALPTAAEQEQQGEVLLCAHPRTRERVITQNGVNDMVGYRQCPVSPGAPSVGQRLAPRT